MDVNENDILAWLENRRQEVSVSIKQVPFRDLKGWCFDSATGNLVHQSGRFFSIVGLDVYKNNGSAVRWMQPIINQPEVGLLGILCREFRGEKQYLMQTKIEPGNVNVVQLSPTVQATRSNFTRVHGGKLPAYLEFFQNPSSDQIVVDQLQSEQGARFLRKRNRNIIVRVDEDIPVYPDFRWMTLSQIKRLMRLNNTVNMDARTVLSGLRTDPPVDTYALLSIDEILHRFSMLKSKYELLVEKIGLRDVRDWKVTETEISRLDKLFFRIIGVQVVIANREVSNWCQPIVQPMHEGICVLLRKRINGVLHYLLQAKVECGNFDVVELAPTIQCLTGPYRTPIGYTPKYLNEFLRGDLKGHAVLDVWQSEEGGRFYHEQNRNVVYELEEDVHLPDEECYIWMTMNQMREFLRFNNYLNVQVRSLIAML